METTYVHATPPSPVGLKNNKKKKNYRDDDDEELFTTEGSTNIMFDRRIVRGNTYAAQVVTQNAQREVERLRVEKERAARKEAARKRREQNRRPGTPEAVEGRAHADAQTELYLEELSDRPVEKDVETQTTFCVESSSQEPTPLFVPSKTGADKATDVPAGDLFNFDEEVEPILQVLVGKTLQISMLEVMEEEELAKIRERQSEFERMRNAELAEVQRLDAEAARKFAEKQRRVAQESKRREAQLELQEKIAARNFAKHFFADVADNVFEALDHAGAFQCPVRHQVSQDFLPWLLDAVVHNANLNVVSRDCLDDVLRDALLSSSSKGEGAVAPGTTPTTSPPEAPPREEHAEAPAPSESPAAEDQSAPAAAPTEEEDAAPAPDDADVVPSDE